MPLNEHQSTGHAPETQQFFSDIERRKLEAINEINKRFDEKLIFVTNIQKYAIWSIGVSVAILVVAFGALGIKQYRDIPKRIEAITKDNANKIIESPEFQSRIKDSLGKVIEQKINDVDDISSRIKSLKLKLSDNDIKKVVHNLFDDIEPRLQRIENLEKTGQIDANENSVAFLKNDKKVLAIQLGVKQFVKSDISEHPANIGANRALKIPFSTQFKDTPRVFCSTGAGIAKYLYQAVCNRYIGDS